MTRETAKDSRMVSGRLLRWATARPKLYLTPRLGLLCHDRDIPSGAALRQPVAASREQSMSEPALRAAIPADVPAIERVVQAAYARYLARMDRPPGPMLDDYAAHAREGHAWVLEREGAILGVLVLLPEADHLLLDNIAVSPAHHGQGLGRLLLGFAEAEARRQGYGELRLYTNAAMHENVAMYAHLGWIEYARGEQAGYRRVFMRKPLAG